nr:hypothetical protein [Tanacetum cinerariifolium]
MPLDNLEFSDSDDSSLRINISSRLSVNSKTVELLTFTPSMGDSPEGMLVVAYCIVIQRRVEDLQLGVESHQKKLNLTKPDTYLSNLKRKEAYIAYSNPRGFIYQNKDKHNRLMRFDELHKFSDGMLIDVRTALDDHLKGIRMKYLSQSIWRKSDKDRAAAMIHAIDKRLKTRRIMRNLERTMDTTINQPVARDEALAFLVTVDVPEIYMQEFWATTTIHHHAIRFKMDNKKHIVNLESFKEMLHICPRLPHQPFVEQPFEEEILAFLCFLRYSGAIRNLTDVNINKLHQPWRSFAAIINKCLTGKSSEYDNLQLSQAQILWGLYHKRNVDFAYLMWEDFVYQGEHKDTKKRVTLTKPKASVRKTRSSSNTTITPPTAVAGPRLTTSEKGKQAAKASKAKSLSALSETRSSSNTTITPPTAIAGVPVIPTDESEEEISWNLTDEEGDDDEGKDGDGDGDDDDVDEEKGGDNEQASDEEEFIYPSLSTHVEEEPRDEESFDPISKTPEDTNDEGNGEENLGINVGRAKYQLEEVYKATTDQLDWVNPKGQQYPHNMIMPLPLIPNNRGRCVIPFDHFINNDLKYLRGGASSRKYTTSVTKTKAADYGHIKWIEDLVSRTMWIQEPIGYDKHAKRHRDDDADKDEEPFAGPDRGSKRRREGKEQNESATAEDPMQTTFEMEEPSHPEFETGADD